MNNYQKLKKELEDAECKTCYGSVEGDDADFGDISFNTWTCSDCKGSGIIKEKKE